MLETYKLPNKLRRGVERELSSSEVIRWIDQPISRFFTRSTVGICLILLVPLIFFAFTNFSVYEQARNVGRSLDEFIGITSILVLFMGIIVPLILILFIPFYNWLEARQTVYAITNKRAFILKAGWSSTAVTSFLLTELRVISRRENKDGSGDIIVYIHKSKDYDGDIRTEEIGFKQIHNVRAFEKILYQLNN